MWAVEELFIIRAISHLQNTQFCVPRGTEPRTAIDHDHDLKLSRQKNVSESKLHVLFGICAKSSSQMLAGTEE